MLKKIAIIPARSGSKRIPKKNIKLFAGKPILYYSIDIAIKSNCFDEIMVSTDDDEIAKLAIKYGASVPFLGSIETSSDISTTSDVLVEVLNRYKKIKMSFNYACCIYPTAPFITKNMLNHGLEILMEEKASTLIPVLKVSILYLEIIDY